MKRLTQEDIDKVKRDNDKTYDKVRDLCKNIVHKAKSKDNVN